MRASPCGGAGISSSCRICANFPRSSARSIASGEVPRIAKPSSWRIRASFSGVCPPELGDHAHRPFGVADREHVFGRERFEVQPARGVVVGRDGLGVRVHHHRLEPGLLEREGRVHARVVELDALTDPVRAGAEDHDARPFRRQDLGFLLVGRVVVRRARRELAAARVDGLEHGRDAQRLAVAAHRGLGRPGQQREAAVGHPQAFRVAELARRRASRAGRPRSAVPSSTTSAIWSTNHGSMPRGRRDLLDRDAGVQRALDQVEPHLGAVRAGRSGGRPRTQPGTRHRGRIRPSRCPRRALPSASLKVRPIAITSPTDFIVEREPRVGLGELLEGEPRDLHDHVVERRLERRGRLARDVVHDLVEPVADREEGGDLRDREPGGLRGERARARDARVHLDQHLAAGLRDRTANCTFEPPVSTPITRSTCRAVSRIRWYSRSVRVCCGATVIESPVCTPIGSTFSIEQIDDAVVVGVAHHLELELLPARDRLLDEDLGDRRDLEAARGERRELLGGCRRSRCRRRPS